MNKHTPGPWRINEKYKWQFVEGGRGYESSICMIDGMPYPSEKPGPVMRANARLIAAAPDLLEALEKIAASEVYPHGEERYAKIAQDAIAKATTGTK